MSINPSEVYEKYRISGEEWATLDGAASLLEESRKSIRAQIMCDSGATTAAKAEMMAEASAEYQDHLKEMVNARTKANIARVNFDALRSWIDLVRSVEASNRAQAQIR